MKSLSEAGIGVLPWMQPRDILGAPFAVTMAEGRMGTDPQGRPKAEVVYTCRLLRDSFTPNGEAVPLYFWMSLDATGPRTQFISHFQHDSEELGPLTMSQLAPSKNGLSGVFAFIDVPDFELEASAASSLPAPANGGAHSPGMANARRRAAAPAGGDPSEDLPF